MTKHNMPDRGEESAAFDDEEMSESSLRMARGIPYAPHTPSGDQGAPQDEAPESRNRSGSENQYRGDYDRPGRGQEMGAQRYTEHPQMNTASSARGELKEAQPEGVPGQQGRREEAHAHPKGRHDSERQWNAHEALDREDRTAQDSDT